MMAQILIDAMVKSPYDENGCCVSCGYVWLEEEIYYMSLEKI